MKISGKTQIPAPFPATFSSKELNAKLEVDLVRKVRSREEGGRRIRNPSRVRRAEASVGKRSRPETPLLKWKVDDPDGDGVQEDGEKPVSDSGRRGCRRVRGATEPAVSARKLAAGFWRLQLPEGISGVGSGGLQGTEERLGFQSDIGQAKVSTVRRKGGKAFGLESKDLLQSPHSFAGIKKKCLHRHEPPVQFSNLALERATKWDPNCLNDSEEICQIYSRRNHPDRRGRGRGRAASVAHALEAELERVRVRIQELETERQTSKKKMEHVLRKVSEEKSLWRRREHEKIRAFIDDVKSEMNRERKNRQRVEIVNTKLVNELADAKVSAKRIIQDYERERKERELLEEVCDELAKEIGEDKAEVEELKRESMKFRDEVEEERKMLQMAEVWREERVQMKLVDAKLALENKYSLMMRLIVDLENFLRSRGATPDEREMREAVLLRQAAAAISIQDIKEFCYEPPNPDDIFSIFEDVNIGVTKEREIEPYNSFSAGSHGSKICTVSLEVDGYNATGVKDDVEEDESGWETASHLEDQGSSYSPEGSIQSVNKKPGESRASRSGMEWEEIEGGGSPITEITEVCSVREKPLKKASSIARLWRSGPNNCDNNKTIPVEGINRRASNGRMSNGSIISPDRWSARGRFSPPDLPSQLSSPDSRNAQITRLKKGCIPITAQRHNPKAKPLEVKMETQKVQLRQVLEQNM